MEKVSIIIPIYNVRDYINGCLRSVSQQTYNNIEVILVNDCTPDDSMAVAKEAIMELKTRFDVKVVNHEINKGLAEARNSGMRAATGEYIYFLDSDDKIIPECIELLHSKFIKYPNITYSTGGVTRVFSNKKPQTETYPEYISSNEELFKTRVHSRIDHGDSGIACNRLINRAFLIENNLWFEKGLIYEDLLFTAQLILASTSCSSVREGTYIYMIRENTITSSLAKRKNISDMLYIYKSIYKLTNNDLHKRPKYLKDLSFVTSILHCTVSLMRKPNAISDKDSSELFEDIVDFYRSVEYSISELMMVNNRYLSIRDKVVLVTLKVFPAKFSYPIINTLMRMAASVAHIFSKNV